MYVLRAVALTALCITLSGSGAVAQVQPAPDEHILVTTLEFITPSGTAAPALTCESRIGWSPQVLQRSRAAMKLPDGTEAKLTLELASVERLTVQPGAFWVVKVGSMASAVIEDKGGAQMLRWQTEVSHKLPLKGRVQVGTVALSPGGKKGPSMAIYMGLRVLEEGATE